MINGYKVSESIGEGSTSMVMKATREGIKSEYALKIFLTGMNPVLKKSLLTDVKFSGKLKHPNI